MRAAVFLVWMTCAASAMAGTGAGEQHTLPSPTNPTPLLGHRPPWLGIEMTSGNGMLVPVHHVVRTSPADKAGLHDGDEIVRVDGNAVTTPNEVTRAVSSHSAGDKIDVVYQRNGQTQTASVTLALRPAPDDIMRMEYVGTFAPQLSALSAASGTLPATMNALRGRVAVIEFWATWCGPCRMTMPVLDSLQARYGAQGLSVIGITTEPAANAATFVTQAGLHYAIASDPTNATSLAYGVRNIPTLFVVDKRGVVREVQIGYDAGATAQLEHLVQQLLAEPAPTATRP